ncbi:NADP-dependent oxidoreductase [Nocardiopsis mangrovi]|uniref:NADP-dependent oxidoreductase n=1 Tax=Nocardiopsis mangrovi TaxID=1179818 RepID=A0ABV9DZE4_9ACTN
MRAIEYSRFGGPEVLEQVETDPPRPGDGEVRIRVLAAGVNPVDVKQRSGMFADAPAPADPVVPGHEAVGTIEEIGPGVSGVEIGQEVFGWTGGGGYAESATLTTFFPVIEGLTVYQAAALPVAGEAAVRGIAALGVDSGRTLLVNGASGAVGTIAVQLAAAQEIVVIGTASPTKQAHVASLGATPVVYGDGWADRVREIAPNGVDAVFDVAGHGVLADAVALAGGADRVVTIADGAAFDAGVEFLVGTAEDQTEEVLAMLAEAVTREQVVLPAPRLFPLDQAAEAHRASERGQGLGKILLVP